jgi:hypothetical protein
MHWVHRSLMRQAMIARQPVGLRPPWRPSTRHRGTSPHDNFEGATRDRGTEVCVDDHRGLGARSGPADSGPISALGAVMRTLGSSVGTPVAATPTVPCFNLQLAWPPFHRAALRRLLRVVYTIAVFKSIVVPLCPKPKNVLAKCCVRVQWAAPPRPSTIRQRPSGLPPRQAERRSVKQRIGRHPQPKDGKSGMLLISELPQAPIPFTFFVELHIWSAGAVATSSTLGRIPQRARRRLPCDPITAGFEQGPRICTIDARLSSRSPGCFDTDRSISKFDPIASRIKRFVVLREGIIVGRWGESLVCGRGDEPPAWMVRWKAS